MSCGMPGAMACVVCNACMCSDAVYVCSCWQVYFFNQDTGESVWTKPSGAGDVVMELPDGCNPKSIPPVSKEDKAMLFELLQDVYSEALKHDGDELSQEALVLHLGQHIDRIEDHYKAMTCNEGPFGMHEYVCAVWYLGKSVRNFPPTPVQFELMLVDSADDVIQSVVTRFCILAESFKRPSVIEKAEQYKQAKFGGGVDVGCKRPRECSAIES